MRWRVIVAGLLLLVACGDDDGSGPAERGSSAVVVASFDFAESRVLGEIYAQALEDEGVDVQRELGLGRRELVLPALREGLVDLLPEYAGSALDATAPDGGVDRSDLVAVTAALADAVEPWGLTVLIPSAASNQNVLAVPAALAAGHDLRTVSDLAPLAGSLVIGGPPECPQRPRCLPGLNEVYGLRFEGFVPLGGEALVRRALADGVVDVGVMFSTDASLAGDELVVLDDDRRLQPPDNVVPVVRTSVLRDRRVAVALDEVTAELTTTNLRFLNWRVANAGAGIAEEARGWLVRHGLVAR